MNRDISGNTPLHLASMNGQLPAAKVLVEYGAKVCLTMTAGRDNYTPAALARKFKHKDMMTFLGNVGLGNFPISL